MKKFLLPLAVALSVANYADAQQRLVLYEEFTGENCGPCAATNPGLEALMKAGDNPNKILILKYQVPIPSAGPIYYENTSDSDNRRSYYGVSSAPNARMDGSNSPGGDGGGHPGYLTQAHIDSRAAISSNFNITLSDVSITSSGVSATISVQAIGAGSYGNLKLRAALVETLDYATPPGTNGETHFMNVSRKMYPGPDGQAVDNTWSAGETNTYTISGTLPSYVNLSNEHFLVVWLQDDTGKEVHQAARSYVPLDLRSDGLSLVETGLKCGTPNNFTLKAKIANNGSETITSATIYYKVEGGTWTPYSWTGSLAKGASTEVTLPALTGVTNVGNVVFYDSLANPNGSADAFLSNNKSSTQTFVLANSGGTFPISANFEAGADGFTYYYSGSYGYPLARATYSGGGYDGSTGFLYYPNYSLSAGANGYSILPFANLPAGPKSLDFYVAYCQYSNENDKLEVVYSTDCGATWTSLWSKQGSSLATKAAQTGQFIPSSNSHWRLESVDLSAVPNGAQIAFKATSAYGNNLFIDNVNLRAGTTGVDEYINNNTVNVYPNPVTDVLNINLEAIKSFEATISITDVTGKTIYTSQHSFVAGANNVAISTEAFATGNYFINIATEEGSVVKQFIKK